MANIMHNTLQKHMAEKNMLSFQNAMSNVRLEEAIDKIKISNESEIKTLALSVLSQAKKSSVDTKNSLVEMVEAWSIHLNSFEWTEELRVYCKQQADIESAYSVRFLNRTQLVIVVDDMSKDTVLAYNEFAFGLRDKYSNIYDFMVIDVEALSYMKDEFETCKELYKRG